MKPIGESEKVFEAYGIIDYCYYALKEINKGLQIPLSPIERMVDQATGNESVKESAKATIELLEEIITNKKIIDADFSKDEIMLNETKKFYESTFINSK